MTATHVDGVEVIADEPTRSAFNSRDGEPVYWKQNRTLLLADGRTVYGCLHCDYTSPNVHSIRPHLNRHRDLKQRQSVGGADDTLSRMVRKLAEAEEIADDRDRWKARAVAAEKQLRTLRRALGNIS
ncbi:hypothetical protein GCM10010174_61940 [Kutzneria viridogrisea]|uniref:Zinc finger protein 462-like seventh C2H2 zinc finger domain-containing protein n=1 Tax=Kutzneria viridogrisea TaxID=47990 RepID=A0ABR6BG85_9PSEU|nr:hypothetical protein [Kutzneria viridogrisea]